MDFVRMDKTTHYLSSDWSMLKHTTKSFVSLITISTCAALCNSLDKSIQQINMDRQSCFLSSIALNDGMGFILNAGLTAKTNMNWGSITTDQSQTEKLKSDPPYAPVYHLDSLCICWHSQVAHDGSIHLNWRMDIW